MTTVIIREVDDEGRVFYVASHPELDGCIAQGSTPEEAADSLDEARELWLEAGYKRGEPRPEPRREG